jgi:hypothetical protein
MLHQGSVNMLKPTPKQASEVLRRSRGRNSQKFLTRRQPTNRLRAADLQYLEAADTEFAQVL